MFTINEIFYSIQGEGYHTGTPAVFIRFSGCNLRCSFCDTQHETGVKMTPEEVVAKALAFPARHLVLTGGEPSLYVTEPFVQLLKEAGFYVQIETNGTRPLPPGIDWVTCSPKEQLLLTSADELKVVYTGQDLSVFDSFACTYRCLQPCSNQNREEVVAYVLQHPEWQLSVQLHKILHIA